MAYSYTEKKRIRKDFSRNKRVLEVPYLLAIQLDSYRSFLNLENLSFYSGSYCLALFYPYLRRAIINAATVLTNGTSLKEKAF